MTRELPSDWGSRRERVYERDDYECQNCGRTGGPRGHAELHAHHNVPRHSGGTHRLSNLMTVCSDCHDAIHHEDVDAPSAGDARPAAKTEREAIEETIASPFTFCSNCRQREDVSPREASEFLEYDRRPREFLFRSRSHRIGTLCGPYRIRCGECGTLYARVKGNGEYTVLEPVEFDDDVSSNWYYGVLGSMLSYLTFIGILSASLTMPISMYYDIKHVRATTDRNPNAKFWVWPAVVPFLNLLVGYVYLNEVRNVEVESETAPVLETCPLCGFAATELPRRFPPDRIDCTECGARFEMAKLGLGDRVTLVDGDADRVGETHPLDEWQRMAQSAADDDLRTNLLDDADA